MSFSNCNVLSQSDQKLHLYDLIICMHTLLSSFNDKQSVTYLTNAGSRDHRFFVACVQVCLFQISRTVRELTPKSLEAGPL